jgi:hypothetical protein
MANEKFRPSLTLLQIQYILDLCNVDTREGTYTLREAVSKQLKIFLLKAQIGAVSASHTVESKVTLEEALSSPAELRLAAYKKWQEFPHLCTKEEVGRAATYRYENGMMTTSEENDYENLHA